jgi:hypothetical protein
MIIEVEFNVVQYQLYKGLRYVSDDHGKVKCFRVFAREEVLACPLLALGC